MFCKLRRATRGCLKYMVAKRRLYLKIRPGVYVPVEPVTMTVQEGCEGIKEGKLYYRARYLP